MFFELINDWKIQTGRMKKTLYISEKEISIWKLY